MQKARILLVLLGLCWFSGHGFLYAQEQDEEEEEEDSYYREGIPTDSDWDDWDGYMSELYSWGDQTITILAGVNFPTVFLNNGKVVPHHINPPVGGILSLAYTYFFGAHFFLGGGVSFYFDHTLGQNTVFLIPLGLRTGWQFVLHRFEFPLELTGGVIFHRYLNFGYTGFFLKGGASAYFRFNPDWSFGLCTDWSWLPQRPQKDGKAIPNSNMDANLMGLTLSARYHF
ncbi:MAG: hypothetical protein LBH20_08365 [Treponema sp.]|jgi:hypothetical protein|nr:hypothetical protein [Treponema sp.]